MGERFGDDLFDAIFLLRFGHGWLSFLVSGVAADYRILKRETQVFHIVSAIFV
jgi:hypothetical protein